MASTADPSQRCQAHFADGTYNTIRNCNMGKVSVQILQHEHKKTLHYTYNLKHGHAFKGVPDASSVPEMSVCLKMA